MKILLKAQAFSDMAWCEYAVVDLTPELRKEIQARRELFQMVSSKDTDIKHLSFWGFQGDFYDALVSLDDGSLLTDAEVRAFDADEFIVLKRDVPASEETSRTECNCLIVRKDGFFWQGIVKHTDVDCETAVLSYDILLED